jgi:AcrR family transcriptional regulator
VSTRVRKAAVPRGDRRFQPRNTPRQERSRVTRELVLTAAAQVFEARGFAAGTTNRIAQRAGVSIGTLYQYYPTKEAIAVELVERHLAGQVRAAHEWGGRVVTSRGSLRDLLRSFAALAVEAHEAQPHLHHVLLEEAPLPRGAHEAIRAAEGAAASTLAGVLRGQPGVRRRDLDRAALLVVQITVGMVHRVLAEPAAARRRAALLEEVVDVVEAYLASAGTEVSGGRAAR